MANRQKWLGTHCAIKRSIHGALNSSLHYAIGGNYLELREVNFDLPIHVRLSQLSLYKYAMVTLGAITSRISVFPSL